MSVLDDLAQHLHDAGLVTFDAAGITGDLFIETMPTSPDEAVALFGYGGPESHGTRGWDSPRVQVRVRGTPDPRVSRARCQAIYDALHGLSNVVWGATRVTSCVSIQSSPQSMGKDDNNRHEHIVNLQLEVRNPARPAL